MMSKMNKSSKRGRGPRRAFKGLGVMAVLGVSCASPVSQTAEDDQSVRAGSISHRVVPTRDACPERRFVGLRLGATCPAARSSTLGSWRVSSPFKSRYHAGALPAALDGYCQYDWSGRGTPDTTLLPSEARRRATTWLETDCQVVAPLGSAFASVLAPSLRSAFLAQTDSTGLAVNVASHERASLVSVIDSSAGQPGVGLAHGGRSNHGYTVARVIRQLACADPEDQNPRRGCMAYIDSPLALPRVDADTVDYNQGGYFGSHADLASAIFDAVARFDNQGALPVDRQILNLSVGWSPRWGGQNPRSTQTSAPIRAVFAALEYARCHGALIIAAAGNVEGGGTSASGLMYPAAWMTETAVCGAQGSAPLLYAAGGVNHADDALANGRPAGHPRLVAPSDHAVALDRHTSSNPEYTGSLSGTSVSAAVLTAAAAVVWGYRPTLSPEQVIDTIYAGAVDLGVAADVCAGTNCSVRRISICRAVNAACSGAPGGACPPSLPVCAATNADDAPQAVFDGQPIIDQLAASVTTQFPFAGVDQGFVAACNAHVVAATAVPAEVCPLESRDTWVARPYVDPQPSVPVCPDCFVMHQPSGSGWDGIFPINTDLPATVEKVTIEVVVDGDHHIFGLEPAKWNPGELFKVKDLPIPAGTLSKAALTYVIVDKNGDAYVGTEPLLIYK